MNPRGSKINIALDSPLDLTRNKVDVTQFNKFEEKNSPIYGSCLSPLYKRDEEVDSYSVFSTNGDRYSFEDNYLLKNGEQIMDSKGRGYFTITEKNLDEWQTYAVEGEHVLKSKYEQGIIHVWFDDTEKTFTASSVANAVIDARSRIIDGKPITAYVFATPTSQYQFVYISDTHQQSYLDSLKVTTMTTSQILADTTAGSGTFFQNRNSSISTSESTANYGAKGFQNPLIQIAKVANNVYAVSFYSNHGGKIDPNEDMAYYNIFDNNGTFYNSLRWNTSSSQVELEHSQTISIVSTPSVAKKNSTGTCYSYEIPSGDASYDAKHSGDVGKYFLEIDRYGNLANEVKFDAGYTPQWQSTTTDFNSDNVQYIKYQQFSYSVTDDILTITTSTNGMASGDTVQLSYNYTPKVKHYTWVENYDVEGTTVKQAASGSLYENGETVWYKKKLIANTGTDTKIELLNDKTSYRYKPLKNALGDWTDIANPKVVWEQTQWCILNDTDCYESDPMKPIYQSQQQLRRNIHSTTDKTGAAIPWVDKDGNVVANNSPLRDHLKELDYDEYPIVWSTTQAYHEATVGETYDGVVLEEEEDLYQLDVYGNKIPADIAYWNTLYGTAIYWPMDPEKTAAEETLRIPTIPTVTINDGQYVIGGNINYTDTLYKEFFNKERYVYWTEGTPATFSSTLKGNATATWQFAYEKNSTEYDPEMLWEGFDSDLDAVVTLSGQSPKNELVGRLSWNGDPLQLTKTYTWTTTQTATQIMTPNTFLDDGTAISVSAITHRAVIPVANVMVFQARPTGVSGNLISFNATGYYNTEGVDQLGCILTSSIDLNMNYMRRILSISNGTNSTAGTVYGMQILYDSASGTYCNAGGLSMDTTTGNGWFNALYFNNQGSIAKADGKWRYLINSSGLLSGLSYGDDQYIGTLLTEWNSLAEDRYIYSDDSKIGWKSTDGKWYEIERKSGVNPELNIIFDRYIIIQTDGFWNAYDIEDGRPMHYATDFNNRVMPGVPQKSYSSYVSLGRSKSTGHTLAKFFVSGINSMYEVSGNAITSIQISPQAYINITTGYETFVWCKNDMTYEPQYVEVFAGINTDATSATYQYSRAEYEVTGITLKNSALIGLNSPVAIAAATYYSPNIFTEYIHTYNNKDLVKNGKYGYPIVWNETTPILSYSSGKQLSNVDSIFVIQSQFYALIGGKIVSITYDDYTIIGVDAIIDISGMKYLGYLPTKAYFWSPANRTIYSFSGDANLSVEMEANAINEVYATYYSTQKEALMITTDKGIYFVADVQMYHIDSGIAKKVWFVNDGYFIVEREDNSLTYYSYERDILPDSKKIPVVVETKYFGPANGQTIVVDKVSVQFNTDYFEEGYVSFFSATATDVGFKSENKKIRITADMIDKLNKSFVINYTPQYAQGQGFKVGIQSDFPITRITESVGELLQNTSTKHNG